MKTEVKDEKIICCHCFTVSKDCDLVGMAIHERTCGLRMRERMKAKERLSVRKVA